MMTTNAQSHTASKQHIHHTEPRVIFSHMITSYDSGSGDRSINLSHTFCVGLPVLYICTKACTRLYTHP